MIDRTANLLGAVAQLVSDRQAQAIDQAVGLNGSSAAALITIGNAPEQRIDFLYKVLGLSQSATTRMVAKLETQGLIKRAQTQDGRTVSLVLSAKGKRTVKTILEARDKALFNCLGYLTAAEQGEIDGLLAKLLAASVIDEHQAFQMCRFCNGDDCDPCPVEEVFEQE
ncbi:MAG: MarR family transcriptional regulator [Pseudohongiella sp.]|nr:MAG: MarR family transcriptional regulator [Pseudohongiella sp.]